MNLSAMVGTRHGRWANSRLLVAALIAAAVGAAALLALRGSREAAQERNSIARVFGVLSGRFHGRPFMSRRAGPGERMRPGESLLVRFRLSTSAAVHLNVSGPAGARSLWPDGRPDVEPPPPPLPAGEHTLLADRQPLALDAREFGNPVRVLLTASPAPFDDRTLAVLRAHRGETEKILSACPRCSVDSFEVVPPPEGVAPPEPFR